MKFNKPEPKQPLTIRLRKQLLAYLKMISRKHSSPGNYVSLNEIIEKAIEIRSLFVQYNGKASNSRQLAEKFGVSKHTIMKVLQNKTWQQKSKDSL